MKLVIFDIDGTLVNSNEIDTICFIDAFTQEFAISNINCNWSEYFAVTDSLDLSEFLKHKHKTSYFKQELKMF